MAEEVVEMTQNVSLLLDDIEDSSLIRRGLPCAHLVYGIPATINSSTYYMFVVLDRILQNTSKDQVFEVMSHLFSVVMDAHKGQQMDIFWRDNLIVPTLEE